MTSPGPSWASLPVSENLQFRLHSLGSRMDASPASSPPTGPFSAPSSPPLAALDPSAVGLGSLSAPPSPPLAPLPVPLTAHHPRFNSLSSASTERPYHPRFDSYSSTSDRRIKPSFSVSTSVPPLALHALQENTKRRPSRSTSGAFSGPTRARANSAIQARHNKGAYMSYKLPTLLMNQSEAPLPTRLYTALFYALVLPPIFLVCACWWLLGHSRVIAAIEFVGVVAAYLVSAFSSSEASFVSGERDGSFSSSLGDLALLLAARAVMVYASISFARYRSLRRACLILCLCLLSAAFAAVKLYHFGWDAPSSALHWTGDNQVRARALFAGAFVFSALYMLGELWVPTSMAKLNEVEEQILSVRPSGFRLRAKIALCAKSGLSYIFARRREPTDPASPSVSRPVSEPSSAHSSPRDPAAPDGSPAPSPPLSPSAAPVLSDALILDDSKPRPVFVLLPGFGAGKMVFLGEAEVLSEFADVYVLDLMGTGSSARPVFPSRTIQGSEDFFVDAMEAWRSSLGIGPMVLCGHSLGGYIAGCYALRYPQHVAHLVLASPVGIPEVDPSTPPHPMPFAWPIRALLQSIWSLNLAPQSILRFLGPLGPLVMGKVLFWRFADTPMRDKELVLHYMYHHNAGPASGERGLTRLLRFGLIARCALGPRLSELSPDVALTFIYGANDVMDSSAGFRVTQVLRARKHARADVYHVAGAGHQVFLEKHHVMSAALSALIRGSAIPLDPYPHPAAPLDSYPYPHPGPGSVPEAAEPPSAGTGAAQV